MCNKAISNKTIFFSKNIIKSLLLLLIGIGFTSEIAHCAVRVTDENANPNISQPNQQVIKKQACQQTPRLQPMAHPTPEYAAPFLDVNEDIIGTVTPGQILDLPKTTTAKYEKLDWWFSVLSTIQQLSQAEPEKTYTEIVDISLNQRGLIYKANLGRFPYNQPELSQEFGISVTPNDFETAFDTKINDFRKFSINELAQKISPMNQNYFQKYIDSKCFFTILQKEDISQLWDYTIKQPGDLHGDLVSLLVLLKKHANLFNADFSLKDKTVFFVFTGDNIDRGQFGLEVLYILLTLKIQNPENVFLLLGNHEASHKFLINLDQGFAREIARKFNFGEISFAIGEYTKKPSIFGPGAEFCKKFMHKLEINVFKYLPSALFLMTEFGHVTFCHGLPDVEDKQVSVFLANSKNQIGFINKHPETASFTTQYIDAPGSKNASGYPTTSLETLGYYMNEEYTCLVMRGHQHTSEAMGTPFEIEHGGVIQHSTSPCNYVVTTSSFDSTSYNSSPGIGDYAHFCQLCKEDETLKVQGLAIDRHSGMHATLTDRESPILEIQKFDIDHEQIDLMLKEIESVDISSIPEFYYAGLLEQLKKLSPFYYFKSITNMHYFFKKIESLNKININGIYELLISLKILDDKGDFRLHKLQIPSNNKCAISCIISNKADGISALIENIKTFRMQLLKNIIIIRDQKTFISEAEVYIATINKNKEFIIKHLYEILELLGKSKEDIDQIRIQIESILGSITQPSI